MMRTQLQIGEIAQLLGITQKAVRHYHKIGLLQEPERTEAGYRLYSASDLLRLQRIRRLQALGLSLKQVKAVLGDPAHEHTLREVLQSLDTELAAQIHVLEQQREKISKLLQDNVLEALEQADNASTTLAYVQEHLGDYLANLSPALRDIETKAYTLLDSFNWPGAYQESVQKLTHYFASHPALYRHLLLLGERLASLGALPEDAPEVDQLVEDCIQYGDALQVLFEDLSVLLGQFSQLEGPMASAMSALLTPMISPTYRRFFEELSRRHPFFQQLPMSIHNT